MTQIPTRLKDDWVVIVNEYPANGSTGHINLTFVDHLMDRGTYGQNIKGWDASKRFHSAGAPGLVMPGGVFTESNGGAMQHFVIVSRANFYSMITYAQSRAQLTVTTPTTYSIAFNNCSDFAFQVFQHSDLTAEQKDVSRYVHNKGEAVGAYNEAESTYYDGANLITDTRKAVDKVLHR